MSKGARTRFYADIMSCNPEVTGSCHLVVVKFPDGTGIKFMVDCGLFQEKDYNEKNQKLICKPENLDFLLVTHNHIDHIGRIPYLVKMGFENNIYMTRETSYLIGPALQNSGEVLRELAKRTNTRVLYSADDIDETMQNIVPCDYEKPIFPHENVKVTFLMNGHLVGAAVILVQIFYPEYEDINLLFTGDWNKDNMFFDVKPIPEWVKHLPLTVIQESTYGNICSKETNVKCFESNVEKAIQEGKDVVSLVFSLGRAQEILYVLKCMQNDGRLSKDIPIYFDGKLAFKYTSIFKSDKLNIKEEMKDFLPENLIYVDKLTRNSIIRDWRTQKILVTTSGMGSYGPAQTYIPAYLPNKNVLIHFTGYCAEGTLGRTLKDTPTGEVVEFSGMLIKKQAEVQYTSEYSAHAKSDEMIEFLQQFKDLRVILINHGEKEVKKIFANKVLNKVEVNSVGILGEGYLFRVDHFGYVKSMNTKFE